MKTMSIWFNKEQYREIPGCEGIWISKSAKLISTRPLGRIPKNQVNIEPKRIHGTRHSNGYWLATTKDNEKKNLFIHRAVLITWVGPCPDGFQCRHLNGNKQDNRLKNLIWGTSKENHQDRKFHGTMKFGENHGMAKMTSKKVLALREEYKNKTLVKLCLENPKLSKFAIWAAVSGYTWKHLPGAIHQNRKCDQAVYAERNRIKNITTQ